MKKVSQKKPNAENEKTVWFTRLRKDITQPIEEIATLTKSLYVFHRGKLG